MFLKEFMLIKGYKATTVMVYKYSITA